MQLMPMSRATLALLALCNFSLAIHLPTEYPAPVNETVDGNDGGFHAFLVRQDDTSSGTSSCSATNPCPVGCCGNGGISTNGFICGTGSTFCGPGNCTSTCDYKAECNPGGWPSQYWNDSVCPLNVCCSQYGFCGYTSDFCGDRVFPQPSCGVDSNTTQGRRIAYYEGWSTTRACDVMLPTQIPLGLWTHIYVSFGSIDPSTYQVELMDGVTIDIVDEVALLKTADPNLKIYLSIGGWAFTDPGPTQYTFSDLAASPSAQEAFFASLISFLVNNNLDGVDIDWEYPVFSDRGGSPSDYTNYVSFMQNLRSAMDESGFLFGLTCTAPSSYWYLQGMDIISLSQIVDWFNVMTYDLHGTWDASDPYIGNVALAHTNLTEIQQTMSLFWMNNIDPNKITMGLGFYGRSFTMKSSSCMETGCPYSGPGDPGPCTQSGGILSAAEIQAIIAGGTATVTLDPLAAVEILTFGGNQWVSYDDEPTFQMKIEYANSVCIGGVMVWAVDLDNYYFMSTNQLAVAMGLFANSTVMPAVNITDGLQDLNLTYPDS